MKAYYFSGIVLIVLGLLLLAIPHWLFPVCEFARETHSGGMHMPCYWVARAEIGLGVFVAFCGVLFLSVGGKQAKYGVALVSMFAALLAGVTATVIIGGCANPDMICNQATLPALAQASGVGFLVMLFAVCSLRRQIVAERAALGGDKQAAVAKTNKSGETGAFKHERS